ncbi:MAG: uridine kinase [Clostridiaceae bacterium]|jgi:uridine kinase|nr:uridine kinase [Clostridiaceae bacterium]
MNNQSSLNHPGQLTTKFLEENFLNIIQHIDILLHRKSFVILAIDGNSGAGKSTLAEAIGKRYNCNVFHMDHFFLTPELRTAERLEEIGGNVDYVRFKTEVIDGLLSQSDFQYHIYDCTKGTLGQTVHVAPKRLNIIEGCYSMHPSFADFYDYKIFLEVDREEQARRILERSGPDLYQRFLNEWIPLEDRYFQGMHIRAKCDLVLNTSSPQSTGHVL